MKIAIIGKMCSGKSFLSNYLVKEKNFTRIGFGDFVKKYAVEIFGMKTKDRKLLQELGQKLRQIDEYVWVKLLEKKLDCLEKNGYTNFVIDDVRFIQEVESLRKKGFIFIKLDIDRDLQKERIIKTYPNSYASHIQRINDISETQLESFNYDIYYRVNQYTQNKLIEFIKKELILNKLLSN